MQTATKNPILHSVDAFLNEVQLSFGLCDIRRNIELLTKRNRDPEACLILQEIRARLDVVDEATRDIAAWISAIELFAEANPAIRKMA